jgi:nucleotide-binding universal stress UspA family protein
LEKYRKILVAFDGSEDSRNALRQAIKLSFSEGSWIKVLAVVPSYEGELELVGVRNISGVLSGPAEGLLLEAEKIAGDEKASIMTGLEQGEIYERIVDVADAENCSLIVMGRRGHHPLERMLMGSVTARVIGLSQRDVLVVPGEASLGWKNILVCTDGSKYSDRAIEHAIAYAKNHGGSLTVVSVIYVNDEFYALSPDAVERLVGKAARELEGIRKRAEAEGVGAKVMVREGEPHQRIVGLAEEVGAEVIFMGSHGRTGLKRLLMGSVTEKVVGLAPCPVLVVKD